MENLSQDEVDYEEEKYIREHQTLINQNGYNILKGGKNYHKWYYDLIIQTFNDIPVNIFTSMWEASELTKISQNTIRKIINEKSNIFGYSFIKLRMVDSEIIDSINKKVDDEHCSVLKEYILNKYSDDQIDFLIDNYGTMPVTEIAKELNRSVGSIYQMAKFKGLTKKIDLYTNEEKTYIEKNYPIFGAEHCSKALNRSVQAIRVYASKNKIYFERDDLYTKDEETYIKENYKTQSYEEIGEKLGRSASAIQGKIKSMNLRKKRISGKDKEAIYKYIKDNYANLGPKKCAENLNITASMARHYATNLHIHVSDPHKGCGYSAYKYVHWKTQSKKWAVVIPINKKYKQYGLFDQEKEAMSFARNKCISLNIPYPDYTE